MAVSNAESVRHGGNVPKRTEIYSWVYGVLCGRNVISILDCCVLRFECLG